MQTSHQDQTDRRLRGAAERSDCAPFGVEPMGSAPLFYAATSYQGSVEPFRKPDHKAKKHSRPAKWADRRDRRERQVREWAA